jgi:hypothetical protein
LKLTFKPTVKPTFKPTVKSTLKPTLKPSVASSSVPTLLTTVASTTLTTPTPTVTPTVAQTHVIFNELSDVKWTVGYSGKSCNETCSSITHDGSGKCLEQYNSVVTSLETFASLFEFSVYAGVCIKPTLFFFNHTGNVTDFCNAGINSIYDSFNYKFPSFRVIESIAPGPNQGTTIIKKDVICGIPTNTERAKMGKCEDSYPDIMRMCPCDNNCQPTITVL